MESFFGRYKNPLVLALVLLAQFALLAVQVRPHLPGAEAADQTGVHTLRAGVTAVVTPPEKVLHHGGFSLGNLWTSYIDLIGVRQENEQLKAENQRLQLEQAALAEDARQGERLQAVLAFKQHYIDQTIPAQVVGAGGSDRGQIVYIDKGSADGISTDMPVITPDGIVGRIRNVMPHTSQVLEISDPTSAAGVLLEATRTRGLLRGNDLGEPQIVNLMPDNRIKPGQAVLTSGGDQIFPRGLPVGIVDHVVPDPDNPPLTDVILKPAADLHRLEEVLVITHTSLTPSTQAGTDLSRSERNVKDAAKTTAEQLDLASQRASDILAQRLPSATNVVDPDAPDAAPGTSPATASSEAAPLRPLAPLHNDHYSPGAIPSAQNLTPGKSLAPLAEGIPATDRQVTTDASGDRVAAHSSALSPAFEAAHQAALAAQSFAQSTVPARAAATAPSSKSTETAPARSRPHAAVADKAARSKSEPSAPVHSGQNRFTRPTASQGKPEHAPDQAVQTRIVNDGPLPASRRSSSPAKPAPEKPALVPDDGSRPPSGSTAPPQEQR